MFIQSRIVNSKRHLYMYVKRAVRWAHFKMKQTFKVIQGHPYSCRQKSRTDCCHNVQQCRHYFRNLRRYSIGKTANSSTLSTHSILRTVIWEMLSNICTRNNLHWLKLELLIYISAAVALVCVRYISRNYFWKSNALSQELLAKNGFWHEIATQGHSRSRSLTLQLITGQQGIANAYFHTPFSFGAPLPMFSGISRWSYCMIEARVVLTWYRTVTYRRQSNRRNLS